MKEINFYPVCRTWLNSGDSHQKEFYLALPVQDELIWTDLAGFESGLQNFHARI